MGNFYQIIEDKRAGILNFNRGLHKVPRLKSKLKKKPQETMNQESIDCLKLILEELKAIKDQLKNTTNTVVSYTSPALHVDVSPSASLSKLDESIYVIAADTNNLIKTKDIASEDKIEDKKFNSVASKLRKLKSGE